MFKNYRREWSKDVANEADRLRAAGYDPDDGAISEEVQPFKPLLLPSGTRAIKVRSSLTVAMMGSVVALMTHYVTETESVPMMVYDCYYEKLSRNGRRYITTHEDGHLINGHIGSATDAAAAVARGDTIRNAAEHNRSIEQEFQADDYAVTVMGKRRVLAAMHEFKLLMEKNAWLGFDHDELDRRIAHVAGNNQAWTA